MYLLLGQVATTAIGIVFSAALGRSLGAGEFGIYFLIFSFGTFANVLADWGQQQYVIREIARAPERGSQVLGTALVLRAAGTTLLAVPAGVIAWLLGYDVKTRWLCVAFIGVTLPFFLAQGYGFVFRGRDRMGLDAWVSVANKIAALVFAIAALALGTGLYGVLVAQAAGGAVALTVAAGLYRRVSTGSLRFSFGVARELIAGGTALVTMTAAVAVQPYLDAVILSKLAPTDAVGWYGAAKNVMGTLVAPALILGAADFPRLSRAAGDRSKFQVEVRAALRPIAWIGGLGSVGTLLFADAAIAIIYGGRNFGPAGSILKIYALGLFLLFIDVLFSFALTALGRVTALSIAKIASVVLSVLLELALIPVLQKNTGNGGLGVAIALAVSELAVLSGALLLLPRRSLGAGGALDIGRGVASAVLTALFFRFIPALPLYVGLPACVIVFCACSVAVGLVRRDDIQLVRALLRRGRPTLQPLGALPGSSGKSPAT